MKLNIEKAFATYGYNVYEFFQRPGVGFYIPLYQREYSWDKDNIEQLIEDIEKGVSALIEDEDREIRFLGTIITVNENDRKRVQPQDPKSLPSAIEKVIDGQQRITTIALISSVLYKNFQELEKRLLATSLIKEEFLEITTAWKEKLIDLFSFELIGKPKRKPKIIRGHIDFWTKDGEALFAYKSTGAKYLADCIIAIDSQTTFPILERDLRNNFSRNLSIIEKWIKNSILPAVSKEEDSIPRAVEMMENNRLQDLFWQYERDDLVEIVKTQDFENKRSDAYLLSSLYQLSAVAHYLLERCCFTVIQPIDENWAFDMFQSLNASGTPLTAIETFRPLVVNTTEAKEQFENSQAKKYFEKIEELFASSTTAANKSKLTDEFLTSFAIVTDAYKLESHFSSQRKYLNRVYEEKLENDYEKQCEWVRFMGNYANFYKYVWRDYRGENNLTIDIINTTSDAELASLLILFLNKSGHRMAVTILGCFYHYVLDGRPDSIANFVGAVKAIAAFYILWRSADSNAGLDNAYRNFFKGKDDFLPHAWLDLNQNNEMISLATLKNYFKNVLDKKGLMDRDNWILQASNYLSYTTSSSICKLSLMIAAHDTIPDTSQPGLVKKGQPNTAKYLTLENWLSDSLKEIEHIAPQEPIGQWDKELYEVSTNLYNSIGNLTLLPKSINASASNKNWVHKKIYYAHLAETDPDKVREFAILAANNGMNLDPNTIKILQQAVYRSHITPLVKIPDNQSWDKKMVELRSVNILEIVWDRIIEWLQYPPYLQ